MSTQDTDERTEDQPTRSTLDELPEAARKQELERLRLTEEAEEADTPSTMEGLTREKEPIGSRTRLKIEREEEPRLPPSALEPVVKVRDLIAERAGEVERARRKLGDPSTDAPRRELDDEEDPPPPQPRMGQAMVFSRALALGGAEDDEHALSTLGSLLSTRGGPVAVSGEADEPPAAGSTLESLTAGTKPLGDRTPLPTEQPAVGPVPTSTLETLLRIQPPPSAVAPEAPDEDEATNTIGGPIVSGPRLPLRPEPAEEEGAAPMEGLMSFTTPFDVGSDVEVDEAGASTLESILHTRGGPVDLRGVETKPERDSSMDSATFKVEGGPLRLRELAAPRRYKMGNDLSRLVGPQPLPRARLPRRTTRGEVPPPDGRTPIRPRLVDVHCTLAAYQKCPGRKAPVEIGERSHHRLEFRYNRFELLAVRQALYECPGVDNAEPFAGGSPGFAATEAPLGNGMLAQLIITMFRDCLPFKRVENMLAQLEAPLAGSVLRAQLDESVAQLSPLVAHLKDSQRKPTTEPPVPVLHTGITRDVFGHMLVHVDKTAVVVEFHETIARGGEDGIGIRLRDTTRGRGRAARWAQLRQKFFYALVTDNEQARRALRLLDLLPALPDKDEDAAGIQRLKRWLDRTHAGIDVPKTRLEHAVTTGISLWSLLLDDPPPAPRRTAIAAEWSFSPEGVTPEQAACFHSLLETCRLLSVPPWDYLTALLGHIAETPAPDWKTWTPAAWKKAHG